MALGFNTTTASSGDILPIVKWDAKAGDFIQQDRTQGADGVWVKDEKELALPISFAMDLAEIEVGWLSFASGAPDFQMVKASDGQMPPSHPKITSKPSECGSRRVSLAFANFHIRLRLCCVRWMIFTTSMRRRLRQIRARFR